MAYCPVCKTDWEKDLSDCPICGGELDGEAPETEHTGWIKLGTVEDKLSADFAKEILKSYEIPAVVISKSGFFGQIGLTLNPFYSKETPFFEVSVPSNQRRDANAVLKMALGDKWQPDEDDDDEEDDE